MARGPRRFTGGLPWGCGLPPDPQHDQVRTASHLIMEAVAQLDELVLVLDEARLPRLAGGVLGVSGRLRQASRLVDPLAPERPYPPRRGPRP